MEQVILVDEQDVELGTMEKMEAHKKALLHRAFSVFIFNQKGELLLQQRALNKYHSSGLWTNTCCSHPRPGEPVEQAAHRRLEEEMGFDTVLSKAFTFIYKAVFSNGLTEHEFDHVFAGVYEGDVCTDITEVEAYAYYSLDQIQVMMAKDPDQFTAWFHIAFPKMQEWLLQQLNK